MGERAGNARTDALIVAHGQPSASEASETMLAPFAAGVAAALPGYHLASASLASPGRLEGALDRLAKGV